MADVYETCENVISRKSYLSACLCSLTLQAQCSPESISQSSVTIADFSDEILLHILSYIPSYDLVLGVSRVCRKLQILCQDKSLISHIRLHKEYRVSTETTMSFRLLSFTAFAIVCLFSF